ncbi:putative rRNA methylase [Roseimicrobium gellanilyticum]|uniref:Putative rRNA methylase n=1 Tax=Roseimicrobium gellanilyticum TaxID=748857 RepID=A0A366HL86_9BACT|nr:class I SAM-dependent methyltransferase [Roseimicrobium gellanilyticum]RBP43709.1 putative rRNA methylase [Roseimicrobium gellanilyticum]
MPSESPSSFTALPTAVQWSHQIVGPRLRAGDWVVDATAGNGHDSLFLAQRVLPGGRVFTFDLQAQAIEKTRENLASHLTIQQLAEVSLHHAGHERMAELLPAEARGRLRTVMFNFGYLPGGDKKVITQEATSLAAVRIALEWLAEDGIMTVVLYPGHEGGREEASSVECLITALPSMEFEAQRIGFLNFRSSTPFCIAVRRRAVNA